MVIKVPWYLNSFYPVFALAVDTWTTGARTHPDARSALAPLST